MIRPVTKFDIDQVQHLASDPAIAETSNLPLPYPIDGAEAWFERVSRGIYENRQVVFAIIGECRLVGIISINDINVDARCAALDYWVAKEHWGKGHATSAATLALSYVHNVIGLTKVTSSCLKRNVASRRVLQKCGFECKTESSYIGPFKARFAGELVMHYQIGLSEKLAHRFDSLLTPNA